MIVGGLSEIKTFLSNSYFFFQGEHKNSVKNNTLKQNHFYFSYKKEEKATIA